MEGGISALDMPLVATSANHPGGADPASVGDVPGDLAAAVLTVDAGALPGTASAVVDLRPVPGGGDAVLVRPGPDPGALREHAGGGRGRRPSWVTVYPRCRRTPPRGTSRVSFIDDDSQLSQDISEADPTVARLIGAELDRQSDTLEMIASENFTSQAVLQAVGSVLTNKYAEGLPGKRYYGGCEVVDEVEQLAIDRALELFGAEHVNVQPHSGSTANEAAYAATLVPGDRVLAMALSHGGHLTHGLKVNFSGKLYEFHHYGVRRSDQYIDMDQVRAMARELRPALIVAGASAYPRIIDFPAFREIADEVGARFMVDMAHIAGLVAAGVHPSPVGIADIVTTTIHKTLGGPRARHGDVQRRRWPPRSTRRSSRACRAAR